MSEIVNMLISDILADDEFNSRGKIIPLETKIGDRILYDRCTVKEYTIDGVKRFLIREEDIMCVLEPDGELNGKTVDKDDCECDCLCSHCGNTDEEIRETGKN